MGKLLLASVKELNHVQVPQFHQADQKTAAVNAEGKEGRKAGKKTSSGYASSFYYALIAANASGFELPASGNIDSGRNCVSPFVLQRSLQNFIGFHRYRFDLDAK